VGADPDRDRLSESLAYVLKAAVRGLAALAEHDPELRRSLQCLAAVIRDRDANAPEAAGQPAGSPELSPNPDPAAPAEAVEARPAVTVTAVPSEAPKAAPHCGERVDLSPLFKPHPPPPVADEVVRRVAASLGPAEDDLPLIEARCRMKAAGARWAAERRRREDRGEDYYTQIAPNDREIIARARSIQDCYLWMNNPRFQVPADLDVVEQLGGGFEALADALRLSAMLFPEREAYPRLFAESLVLLAEAQSALRAVAASIYNMKDRDSEEVFTWLRTVTAEHGILVERHMRRDDPADAAAWRERIARIALRREQFEGLRDRDRGRKNLFGKARWILRQIVENGDDTAERWTALARTVAELVEGGLKPSDREIRELLLPFHDRIPALPGPPRAYEQVLEEVDRYLALRPVSEEGAPEPETEEVREIARLLEGRRVVLIGGERRPASQRALIQAFRLADLDWIGTREHESFQRFASAVQRPDVALVILAIRWVSHGHGDVQRFCDVAGVPLVRLPAGYNPNQVAHQILKQCGARLAAR
jgi:hypothetical protein